MGQKYRVYGNYPENPLSKRKNKPKLAVLGVRFLTPVAIWLWVLFGPLHEITLATVTCLFSMELCSFTPPCLSEPKLTCFARGHGNKSKKSNQKVTSPCHMNSRREWSMAKKDRDEEE